MLRINHGRACEPPGGHDGRRVLIGCLWPHGITKEALKIDAWPKDIAPSADLRRWFGHDPAKQDKFRRHHAR